MVDIRLNKKGARVNFVSFAHIKKKDARWLNSMTSAFERIIETDLNSNPIPLWNKKLYLPVYRKPVTTN